MILSYLMIFMNSMFIVVRDTSLNDTSSATTLRQKFLSNYQFVEKSSNAFSSNMTLGRIFPRLQICSPSRFSCAGLVRTFDFGTQLCGHK